MKLRGRVALITGGASGIGRACAELFAQHKARIVVADRAVETAEETVACIKRAGGEAVFLSVDVVNLAELEDVVRHTVKTYGRLDIFFHNAGLAGPGTIESTDEADFDELIQVNLKAAFFGSKYAIPFLKEAGGGNILFTSSGLGLKPAPHSPAYSVSKAGLNMLMRALAVALAPDRIRVNSICPGPVPTPLWQKFVDAHSGGEVEIFTARSLNNRLIKRYGTVDEIAKAALYLVSDDASYITGLALPVEGGQHAM
jgi:NAD(P)-dependent dehydrogenase (short-subunit alcohol dehydrogenase family)